MTLQLIIGKASCDHRQVLLKDLYETLEKQPSDQFYYIVPNHIKFESEVATLENLARQTGAVDQYAQSQVQVFSFPRLAWYFMKNTPYYQIPRISSAGLNMIVYQSIVDHADDLVLFKGEATRPGFISKLANQLSELKIGRVTDEDLQQVAGQVTGQSADLDAKLHDLTIVYQAFDAAMRDKYIENTDILNALADFLKSADLSQAHFYIDGFSQFSAQEIKLLQQMMGSAASLEVSLVLDQPAIREDGHGQGLFFQSKKTYHQLVGLARAEQVQVMTDKVAKISRICPDLQQVENYWIASSNSQKIAPAVPFESSSSIEIVQANNRYSEVAQIAAEIRRLVATKGYRYSDFLILSRKLDRYQNVLAPIFSAQEIPYFNDNQLAMTNHPFVELITALFEVNRHYYRYKDLMRLLKTELLIPKDQEDHFMPIDEFRRSLALAENWVLKTGYEGRRWLQEDDWQYAKFEPGDGGVETTKNEEIATQINQIRRFVKETLPPFFKKIKAAQTGQEAAKILYQFLEDTGVETQLISWRDTFIDQGDLVSADQPEQTWDALCDMLDEYVEILGDREFDLDEFLALLQAGFEGAAFAQIPSTLDQVILSESGMVQMNNRKVTFMIGSTDDVMPDTTVSNRLLSDQDREKMTLPDDKYLSDTNSTSLKNEPFLNYLAFSSASERLVFTYSLNGDEDEARQMSPYVSRIAKHFNISIQDHAAVPDPKQNEIWHYLGAKRATLRHLVQVSDASRTQEEPLAPAWQYVYQTLTNDDHYRDMTAQLLGGMTYHNVPKSLAPDIVSALYGQTIFTSISKLEEFYTNEYAYFLKYGLKLQERSVFELSPASTGEFFHAAMDYLIKMVRKQKLDLAALDSQQLNEMVDEIVDQILNDPENLQFAILKSSNRMSYISSQLVETIRRMAATLHEQSKRTPMRATQTEVMFGRIGAEQGMKSLSFELPNNRKVEVRGKIDRIDQMAIDGKNYVGIVDYKSSDHDFNLSDAYQGTTMQMMTYLDAVKRNLDTITGDKDAQIAGALYLHLSNPKLAFKEILKLASDDDFLEALLSKEKYKGILVDDSVLIDKLDSKIGVDGYGKSTIYPFGKKKSDGAAMANSRLIRVSDLTLLLRHTEELIKNAATRIFEGETDLNPAKWTNQRTALQYSPFKSIMQFDPLLTENKYHEITKMADEDVLAALRKESD